MLHTDNQFAYLYFPSRDKALHWRMKFIEGWPYLTAAARRARAAQPPPGPGPALLVQIKSRKFSSVAKKFPDSEVSLLEEVSPCRVAF